MDGNPVWSMTILFDLLLVVHFIVSRVSVGDENSG